MSNDPRNPISNETGEYLQEVAEHKNSVVPEKAEQEETPKPKRTRK